MARPRRIVVCDGSRQRARALIAFIECDPQIEVAASFAGLGEMLPRLREIAPDLIALDVETGGSDLAAAIVPIVQERRAPILLLGGRTGRDEERVAAALDAGAVEAIPEGRLHFEDTDSIWATALRSRIRRLANLRLNRGEGDSVGLFPPPPAWRRLGAAYAAVGIGASVGGPPALATVLGALPAEYPLPVLVVQHLAPTFGEGLVRWLDRSVEISVAVARDGAMLRPGVWMAPEGAHLCLDRTMRLRLDRATERGAHRPSLDMLLESLADSLGVEAVGAVLTGMGRDGAEGVRSLAEAGGLTIAQDQETSAVFGMPGAAIDAGVDFVLSLEEIGSKLSTLRAKAAVR